MNLRACPLVLYAVFVIACRRSDAPNAASSPAESRDTTASAPLVHTPDSGRAAPDWRVIPADTIVMSQYTQFARPLRRLGISPKDPDDFTPYSSEMESDTFSFVTVGEHYVIGPDGIGWRLINDQTQQPFVLPLDTGLYVERLGFTRFQGDPLFIYQQTDNEGASGWVARFDANTLRLKWSARVPGFNVGFALLDAAYLYVTCFGFVGKLDLSTGQYAWRHDNLYHTEGFNVFEHPKLTGDTLTIRANGGRLFLVEPRSGRRIRR
jgi:hypothetical protein